MTKTIRIIVEVYDKTEAVDIERIISAALDSNGIDCTYDVENTDKVVAELEKLYKKYFGLNWHKAPYLAKTIEIVKGA